MKVLITAPSLDENKNVSGISSVTRLIIERLDAEFYHFQAGREDGEKAGIKWIFKQIISVPQFLEKIRREKIDLVHFNTALSPLSIWRDLALAAAARMAKRKILIHLHGGKFLAREFESRTLARAAEKMLKMSDAVIVLSEIEKRIVERRWRNLNVRVLENAVPLDESPDRKTETAEKTIIFLGRLHESKGLPEIIEACRILKSENFNFQFKCFGAGEAKDFFTAEMSQILGDKFYYGGVTAGAEKWKQLAESDIFMLPSRYGEGLPMAMLEAMAAGCVVVAADVASVSAVIKDGANGFLVEPYNTAQIVEKLKMLLSGKADWKILRQNARATVEEKFAIDEYIKKLEKIYREISG